MRRVMAFIEDDQSDSSLLELSERRPGRGMEDEQGIPMRNASSRTFFP